MSYLVTYTGRAIDLRMPRASDVCIEDIAHALARLCRFGGHVHGGFYSVAQHSVHVSGLVAPEHALAGLLHDATEAYVGDCVRPLKRMLPKYQRVEAEMWSAIAARFGLALALPREVVEADERMLATEVRDLLVGPHAAALLRELPEPLPGSIEPLEPSTAELLFLGRYRELVEEGHPANVRA